jgi:hypothetical protein
MSTWSVEGRRYTDEDASLQAALARVHHTNARPLCLCSHPGVPMYVARIDGHYHIKRMPESGSEHAPECASYEPPAALSGLGEVMGHAIKEDVEDGITTLRLDFALTKIAGRAPPAAAAGDPASIKAETSKLTIRALLHYLWDTAHLTRWIPGMTGRRNWATVYKHLRQASQGKVTKGMQLASTLYVPEPFYAERKAEIAQRRRALFAAAARPSQGQKLFIVVGELKEVSPASFGYKLILKQVPDFPFMISEELNKKLKVFRSELNLWNAFGEKTHLMVIATFSISADGTADIEEMALMVANEHWIPFANTHEKDLLDTLVSTGRRFVKGLRYNLPSTRPLASVLITDTVPRDTALYLIPKSNTETYQAALKDRLEDDKLDHLQWEEDSPMPSLPPPGGSVGASPRAAMPSVGPAHPADEIDEPTAAAPPTMPAAADAIPPWEHGAPDYTLADMQRFADSRESFDEMGPDEEVRAGAPAAEGEEHEHGE